MDDLTRLCAFLEKYRQHIGEDPAGLIMHPAVRDVMYVAAAPYIIPGETTDEPDQLFGIPIGVSDHLQPAGVIVVDAATWADFQAGRYP